VICVCFEYLNFNTLHYTHYLCVVCLPVEDDSPSLAVATTGGKILLHSPHIGNDVEGNDGEMPHIRFLNFNKKITALAAGNGCMGVWVIGVL
jgi:hypothetical protein